MVTLRTSRIEELPAFQTFEKQPHAHRFVIDTPLATHQRNFADPDITYLSIDNAAGNLAGYFILAREDGGSVEFRRIIVDQSERGIGQEAIRQMEQYCQTALDAKRIWLDVFEDNPIGRHIYSKLGYRHFESASYENRTLMYFEKTL